MKYEAPYIEIVKFEFKNNVLTASEFNNQGTETPVEGGVIGTEPDYDPFA